MRGQPTIYVLGQVKIGQILTKSAEVQQKICWFCWYFWKLHIIYAKFQVSSTFLSKKPGGKIYPCR